MSLVLFSLIVLSAMFPWRSTPAPFLLTEDVNLQKLSQIYSILSHIRCTSECLHQALATQATLVIWINTLMILVLSFDLFTKHKYRISPAFYLNYCNLCETI